MEQHVQTHQSIPQRDWQCRRGNSTNRIVGLPTKEHIHIDGWLQKRSKSERCIYAGQDNLNRPLKSQPAGPLRWHSTQPSRVIVRERSLTSFERGCACEIADGFDSLERTTITITATTYRNSDGKMLLRINTRDVRLTHSTLLRFEPADKDRNRSLDLPHPSPPVTGRARNP
jgi:hypothetical protein